MSANTSPMKQLFLVHDTHESPWLRQNYLEGAGYRVTAFSGGDECLHALKEARPDLVLLDVLIRGRNGFEVCAAIRADHPAEQLPVILCSEIYHDEVFAAEAERVGAQRLVRKPCPPEELLGSIRELLGQQGGQAGRGDESAA